jgi:hypothetical protein
MVTTMETLGDSEKQRSGRVATREKGFLECTNTAELQLTRPDYDPSLQTRLSWKRMDIVPPTIAELQDLWNEVSLVVNSVVANALPYRRHAR